jgi:hypothetical protein
MDPDRSRLFLLSMLSVPAACGPGAPGGVAPNTPIPTDDDDNALDPTDGADEGGIGGGAWNGCEAFFSAAFACYYTNDSGYDDYTSDGGGGQTIDPSQYCAYLDLAEQYYGRACANALDDAYACMAPYACRDVDPETACAAAWGNAESICGFNDVDQTSGSSATATGGDTAGDDCGEPDVFNDGSNCAAQYQQCPDGNAYDVTCIPSVDGLLHTCVCTMNGGQTMTFDVEDPCTSDAYQTFAGSQCGYPVD